MSDADTNTFAEAVSAVRNGADPDTEAARLYALLTDAERLSLLEGDTPFWPGMEVMIRDGYNLTPYVMGAVDRLGIPGLRFADGPRGCVMGQSTAFPVSMARGATWDVALEEQVGLAIGEEMRAQGANFFGGVCINLPRHPAWGRVQETYSDQPLLLGKMGAALATGVQNHAMACVKHYALNSMENARFSVDVTIDEATLHEVFLPHFKQVIDAGALAVMSSYNSVNGEWAGQNAPLLTDILRDQWGFEGVVVSDFVWGNRSAGKSLAAGLDVEAPLSQQRGAWLRRDMEKGLADWDDVARAGKHTLTAQLRLYASRLSEEPAGDVVVSPAHVALARTVAERSMVLLRNEPVDGTPILPLDPSRLTSLGVFGRLADVENTGDHGSSWVHAPYVITPLAGLRAALAGGDVTLNSETSGDIVRASALAAQSDAAIVVVGYTAANEGEFVDSSVFIGRDDLLALYPEPENNADSARRDNVFGLFEQGTTATGTDEAGGDRASLALLPEDVTLIRAVAAVNPRTIVVVVTAGAVILKDWRDLVPGVLLSWYAGMEGGNALADILFGRANPSGHLPYPIPADENSESFFDRDATTITYDRWYGHRFMQKQGIAADYPLGFGLSYTTYKLTALDLGHVSDNSLIVRVTTKNTGDRAGYTVVQIYGSHPEGARAGERELLGFGVVRLAPGEEKTADINVSLLPLGAWDKAARTIGVAPGTLLIEAASYWGDPETLSVKLNS